MALSSKLPKRPTPVEKEIRNRLSARRDSSAVPQPEKRFGGCLSGFDNEARKKKERVRRKRQRVNSKLCCFLHRGIGIRFHNYINFRTLL
jgi:hypothetical protein